MQLHGGEEFFMHYYSNYLGDSGLGDFVESNDTIEKLLWTEKENTIL
jgi:hypothetical protein